MKKFYYPCAVTVAILSGCVTDLDCRHRSRECAEGFVCLELAKDHWECVAREPPVGEQKVERPKRDVATNAPAEANALLTCPEHRSCVAKASDCVCDSRGRLVSRSIDKNGDEKPDEKATYKHDQEGRPVEVLVDEGIDGVDDKLHAYEYDSRGSPLVWKVIGLPGGNAADEKSSVTYGYDESGKLIAEELDVGLDGAVDKQCKYDPPCPPPIPNPSCKRTCQ
jgi:hypothetical protein